MSKKLKNQKPQAKKAFTLIELLVVIGVIGILVAVILPNLVGMRERARDTRKKSDLAQLKLALRMFYNRYNLYPNDASGVICCQVPGPMASSTCTIDCNGNFIVDGETYMKGMPTNEDFHYTKLAGGDGFLLKVELENKSDPDLARTATRCNQTPGDFYYLCED